MGTGCIWLERQLSPTFFAARAAGCGPRRWRSPELAAGCWGSSAAGVAPGGKPTPRICRRGGRCDPLKRHRDRGREPQESLTPQDCGSPRGSTGGRTDGPRLGFFASVPPQPQTNTRVRCIWSEGYSKKGQDHAQKCRKALLALAGMILASAAASVRAASAPCPIQGQYAIFSATIPLIAAFGGHAGSRKAASGSAVPSITVGRHATRGWTDAVVNRTYRCESSTVDDGAWVSTPSPQSTGSNSRRTKRRN
jgi:hypothetical protein